MSASAQLAPALAPLLLVVSAPSGTGKSSVLARVLAETPGVRFSVSHCTRPARRGEREGVDYHFVDRERFMALVNQGAFLEWADVHGDLKGTARAELERAAREGVDLLLDLDVQGAAQVRARHPQALTVFLLPPSADDMERRLRGRGLDGETAIARRLADARREVRRYDEFDYVLVNDDLDRCVADLEAVLRAARLRRERMAAAARTVLSTFTEPQEDQAR